MLQSHLEPILFPSLLWPLGSSEPNFAACLQQSNLVCVWDSILISDWFIPEFSSWACSLNFIISYAFLKVVSEKKKKKLSQFLKGELEQTGAKKRENTCKMFPCLFLLSACGGGGGVGDFLMDNSRGSQDLAPWSVLTKVIPWARTWSLGVILGWGFGFPGDSSGKELACQC